MRLRHLATSIVLLTSSIAARADSLGTTFSGDTFSVVNLFPNTTTVYTAYPNIQAPGAAYAQGLELNYSIEASQITITAINALSTFVQAGFVGLRFTDLTNSDIANVSLDPSSTYQGIRLSYTNNSVYLNFSGLALTPYETATYDVAFTNAATSVTPEPSSIALLGTGMLGVAGVVRKRFTAA